MPEQMDDVELAAMTSVPVRRVVWKIRDGRIGSEERRALLDALDAVPRDRFDNACFQARMREERGRLLRFVRDVAAEEPGNVADQFRTIRQLAQNIVADLSTDMDADAQPEAYLVDAIEHDCGCIDDLWSDGVQERSVNCDHHMPSPDAEGGRPREADPQGPSNGNDASVDGGGDDGRSRAVNAVAQHLIDIFGIESDAAGTEADEAVGAALDSGGVVTFEDWLHEREWGNAHFADWQRERDRADRAERAEAALRDLLYAKVGHTNGECPHCASHACWTADVDTPIGVLRCKETGLAVIASWAQGDTHWPLWHRARAVLEGRG